MARGQGDRWCAKVERVTADHPQGFGVNDALFPIDIDRGGTASVHDVDRVAFTQLVDVGERCAVG